MHPHPHPLELQCVAHSIRLRHQVATEFVFQQKKIWEKKNGSLNWSNCRYFQWLSSIFCTKLIPSMYIEFGRVRAGKIVYLRHDLIDIVEARTTKEAISWLEQMVAAGCGRLIVFRPVQLFNFPSVWSLRVGSNVALVEESLAHVDFFHWWLLDLVELLTVASAGDGLTTWKLFPVYGCIAHPPSTQKVLLLGFSVFAKHPLLSLVRIRWEACRLSRCKSSNQAESQREIWVSIYAWGTVVSDLPILCSSRAMVYWELSRSAVKSGVVWEGFGLMDMRRRLLFTAVGRSGSGLPF